MHLCSGLYLTIVLIAVVLTVSDADLCYRKFRQKVGGCRGLMRKRFRNAESCCKKKSAAGYAQVEEYVEGRRGKKYYKCVSCEELKQDAKGINTTIHAVPQKPSKSHTTAENKVEALVMSGWTKWSDWSKCSVTCLAGVQERIRLCPSGNCVGEHKQAKPCSLRAYCPVDGNWGPWYPWDECSETCGGGVQIRKRQCNNPPPVHGGVDCEGNSTDTRDCGNKICPVHGEWSDWSEFSECSVTCGKGVKVRMRECNSPAPTYGGRWCRGRSIQQKKCHLKMCPIDGGWSLWGSWTHPTISCGEGEQKRTRSCDSPVPQFGGNGCQGAAVEVKKYQHRRKCPIDGGWTEWTAFGQCNAPPCERGFQLRSRSCSEPRPQHGGRYCLGRTIEKQECTNHEDCHKVDGGWCEFTQWSPCTLTCGDSLDISYRTHTRECNCPAPKNGGKDCSGEHFQNEDCEIAPCEKKPPVPVETVTEALIVEASGENPSEKTKTKSCVGGPGSGDFSDGSDVNCDQEPDEYMDPLQ
ncbi:hemicentin-1-like [Lineus longissimus]|uniref:hemicentin-1-like n=1 Tax=Lineus longissimus TaxID=88925 RepID=UPI00315D75F2